MAPQHYAVWQYRKSCFRKACGNDGSAAQCRCASSSHRASLILPSPVSHYCRVNLLSKHVQTPQEKKEEEEEEAKSLTSQPLSVSESLTVCLRVWVRVWPISLQSWKKEKEKKDLSCSKYQSVQGKHRMLVTVASRKVMGTLNDGAGGTSGAALRQTARRCINQICLAYAHTQRQPYYRFLTTPPQQQAADWKVSKKRGEKSTHAGSSGGCVWPGFEGSNLAAINVEHFLGASCVFFKRLRHLTARKQKKSLEKQQCRLCLTCAAAADDDAVAPKRNQLLG